MTDQPEIKYRAFLSYSHKDRKAARIWRKRLESFRMDPDHVGRPTNVGYVPEHLAPIFQDRVDFPIGGELGSATQSALAESAALILVASPSAARSSPVNYEVQHFRHHYPHRPLLVVLEAKRGTAPLDCFPPALRFELDRDGRVTSEPRNVLAADPRAPEEGIRGVTARLVVGLTGLEREEVLGRVDDMLRRRKHWIVASVIFGATLFLFGGVWVAGQFDDGKKDFPVARLEGATDNTAILNGIISELTTQIRINIIDPLRKCIPAIREPPVRSRENP